MAKEDRRTVDADTGHVEVALVTEKDFEAVKTIYIPPFLTMPDVIVWDQRTFKRTSRETDDGGYVYSEAFVYYDNKVGV